MAIWIGLCLGLTSICFFVSTYRCQFFLINEVKLIAHWELLGPFFFLDKFLGPLKWTKVCYYGKDKFLFFYFYFYKLEQLTVCVEFELFIMDESLLLLFEIEQHEHLK
jgi:hypothetical protein